VDGTVLERYQIPSAANTMTVERSTIQALNSSMLFAVSKASTVSSILLGFTAGGETMTKYEGVLPTGTTTVMFPFTNGTTVSPNTGLLSFYITQGAFKGEKMLTSSHD
jgi:hypothetical protein